MLTDSQIKELSNKMNFPLADICFKDQLPKKIKYNEAYVINLDDSYNEQGKLNQGSHWTCLQVNKNKDGTIEPFFFDPYGAPPSENIKKFVKETTGQKLPYNTKDIQSMMNNACGWYCCALLHFINASELRKKHIYTDAEMFLELFDDLNKSVDFKKNEWILKHFFMPKDNKMRKEINVIADNETISGEDVGSGVNAFKSSVDVKMI